MGKNPGDWVCLCQVKKFLQRICSKTFQCPFLVTLSSEKYPKDIGQLELFRPEIFSRDIFSAGDFFGDDILLPVKFYLGIY